METGFETAYLLSPLSFDPSFLAPVISKFIFKRRFAAPELLLERQHSSVR